MGEGFIPDKLRPWTTLINNSTASDQTTVTATAKKNKWQDLVR